MVDFERAILRSEDIISQEGLFFLRRMVGTELEDNGLQVFYTSGMD